MSEISINIDTEQPRCRHDFVWELDEAGRDRIIESQREIAEILGMSLDTWLSRGISMMLKCFDDPRLEVQRGAAMTITAHVLQRPASDRPGDDHQQGRRQGSQYQRRRLATRRHNRHRLRHRAGCRLLEPRAIER